MGQLIGMLAGVVAILAITLGLFVGVNALVDLARERDDVVCLGGDLTRQTETDLFRDQIPDRFFNAGMAEANLIGMAAGLARSGLKPFVNTFGVFATRRPYDQVAMSVAYPNLPVRLVGFMPGLSSPGGPSHQAIDEVALMRALPNMTVIDLLISAGSGLDLCQQLAQRSDVPVLAISTLDTRHAALEAGAGAFLLKPLEPLQLVSAVKDLLGASAFLGRTTGEPR